MDRISVLRVYVRLVEVGNFTAVASEFCIKQSTVSKWLAALESEHQVSLIDRTTRSQRVTEAGHTFYEHAARVIAAYDEAVAAIEERDLEPRGRIRISLPIVFGRIYVVPLIASFLRQYPQIEIELVLSDRYIRVVEEGFDLAIRVGVPLDSTLRTHSLGESHRRLVASPLYLKAHGQPKHPNDLETHECLVHAQPGQKTLWTFKHHQKSVRCSVRGRVSANNSEATLLLVRQGLGIGLLASWLVDDDISEGSLVTLLNAYQPPPAPVRALTPPGRHLPMRVKRLITHLRTGLVGSI